MNASTALRRLRAALPFLAVSSVLFPTAAHADPPPAREQTGMILQLSAGAAFPTGPSGFKQGWQTGYQGHLFVGAFVVPHLALGASLGVGRFGLDGASLLGARTSTLEVSGGAVTIATPMVELQAHGSEGPVVPFVLGGFGAMMLGVDDLYVSGGARPSDLHTSGHSSAAFGLGAGVRFPVSNSVDLFATVRFVRSLGDDQTSYVPFGIGAHFLASRSVASHALVLHARQATRPGRVVTEMATR